MGPFQLFQGRAWSIFSLVIATAVVCILCFCMFLLKPPKARCFCADHKLLLYQLSKHYLLCVNAEKILKASPTPFQKHKSNKMAAVVILNPIFFLKCLLRGSLQAQDFPDAGVRAFLPELGMVPAYPLAQPPHATPRLPHNALPWPHVSLPAAVMLSC